jgi:hypothetical protein
MYYIKIQEQVVVTHFRPRRGLHYNSFTNHCVVDGKFKLYYSPRIVGIPCDLRLMMNLESLIERGFPKAGIISFILKEA